MKRKLFLLSGIALLGLAIPLTSCGQTDNPSQPDTEEPDIVDPVPEITISVSAAQTSLKVGAETALTVTVTNNTTDKPVTVTSSDATIVSVSQTDGAYKAKALKAGSAVITAACDGKSATVEITVTEVDQTGASIYERVKADFASAAEYEQGHIKSGSYKITSTIGSRTPTKDTYTYEVYTGSKAKVVQQYEGAVTRTTSTYYGIHNDALLIYALEDVDGEYSVGGSTKSIPFGAETNDDAITKADAEKYVGAVDLSASGDLSRSGVVLKITNDSYINVFDYKKDVCKETLKLVNDQVGTYVVTGYAVNYTQYKDFKLTYTLRADGALTSYNFKEVIYAPVDDPAHEGQKIPGDKKSEKVYEATFDYATRVAAGSDYVDFSKLYYTDYVLGVYDGMSTDPITTAPVNSTITLGVVSGSPTTACPEIDTVKFVKAEPADAVEVSEFGDITLIKEGQVTITAKSLGGVSKTATISVTAPRIAYFEVGELANSPKVDLNTEYVIYITPMDMMGTPMQGAEFDVKLTNDETCDAALTLVDADPYDVHYSVIATVAGVATLEITSPQYVYEDNSPATDTYTITFGEPSGGEDGDTQESLVSQAMTALTTLTYTRDPAVDGDMFIFSQETETTGYFTFSVFDGQKTVLSNGTFTLEDQYGINVSITFTTNTEAAGVAGEANFASTTTGADFAHMWINFIVGETVIELELFGA